MEIPKSLNNEVCVEYLRKSGWLGDHDEAIGKQAYSDGYEWGFSCGAKESTTLEYEQGRKEGWDNSIVGKETFVSQMDELKAKLVELFEPLARMASEVTEERVKREAEKAQKEMPKVPVEAMKEVKAFCAHVDDCKLCPLYGFDMCSMMEDVPFYWEIPGEEDE